MTALPKDEAYPIGLRSERRDAMWLALAIFGIVLTMWVFDEVVERVWGPATVNEQTAWRFKSAAERSVEYIIDDKSRPQPGVPKSSAEDIGRLLRGALGRALISFRAAERRDLVARVCGGQTWNPSGPERR